MSGSRNKKQEKNEEDEVGLGTILTGAAVAGVAAAATYGVYKLFQFFQEDSEGQNSSKKVEDVDDGANSRPISSNKKLPINTANNVIDYPKTDKDELLLKYDKDVLIDERSLTPLRRNAEKIAHCFKVKIQQHCIMKQIKFEKFIKCGWGKEFLITQNLDDFTYLLPIVIDNQFFQQLQLNDKSFKLSSDHEYLDVLKQSDGLLTPDSITGFILSSVKISLENTLKEEGMTVSYLSISNGCIHISTVCHETVNRQINVKFIPSIKIDNKYLIPFENKNMLDWKLYYINEEDQFLNKFNPLSSCHKILYSCFINISSVWKGQFALLENEHFKQILFHLINEQPHEIDWEIDTIFEHFVDFMMELQTSLDKKILLNIFDKDYNMYSNLEDEPRKRLLTFIREIISNQNWKKILKSG